MTSAEATERAMLLDIADRARAFAVAERAMHEVLSDQVFVTRNNALQSLLLTFNDHRGNPYADRASFEADLAEAAHYSAGEEVLKVA